MIGEIVRFVLCTLFFWTFFPLLYIILSPFYIFRLCLSALQKRIHPDWIGVLNVRDAFLYEDMDSPNGLTHAIPGCFYVKYSPQSSSSETLDCNSNYMHNLNSPSTLEFKSKLSSKALDAEFLEHALNHFQKIYDSPCPKGNPQASYEKISWYAEKWFGFPFYKKDKNFKLENHVKFCEKYEGREVSEEELEIFVAERTPQPFPRGTSPWECLIFRGKTEPGEEQKYVLFVRFHHMIADGLSLLPLLGVFEKEKMKAKMKTLSPLKSTWKTKIMFIVKFLLFVGSDAVNLLILNKDKNQWTVPKNKLKNKTHMLSSPSMDYELVKRAGKKQGVSPTSAIFACFAGGIHKYLRQAGGQGENMPDKMQMGVAMPVPNHPLEGLVNHWTFATVNLPVSDPEEEGRCKKIEENLLTLMRRGTTAIIWLMAPFHAAIPYKLIKLLTHNDITTLLGSNFPGPRSAIRIFKDYEMEGFRGYLPRLRGNSAVGLTSYTYNDTIRFSLCVDKGLMPERESARQLMSCIQNELIILAGGEPCANF